MRTRTAGEFTGTSDPVPKTVDTVVVDGGGTVVTGRTGVDRGHCCDCLL